METRAKLGAAGAAVALVAVVAAVATFLIRAAPQSAQSPAAQGPESTPPTSSAPQLPLRPGVLAVKLDNVPAARPQTGLSAADTVYVEPVEGRATRLVALYTGKLPAVVGPVRSARETDVQLLAQYGKPVLAYSGSAPELNALLRNAALVRAPAEDLPGAYFRDGGRRMPHNLFVRPDRLPKAEKYRGHPPLLHGRAPPGGVADSRHRVDFGGATYDFTWSGERRRWMVSMGGSPLVSTESGRIGAATVVVQRVDVHAGREIVDVRGNLSPVAVTVGSGQATVLRDGKRFEGTWSRASAAEPTRFAARDGSDLPLAEGPAWILLAPK
ncbi:Protein of unknown function [Amycolatopsis marina]|uniref:DUF3048 domain-containing protein n=1 Tax=Amycolatopsis marina TaxID=490629 RepID=A0A1I0Z2M8_9PSEU|nr:DUF3048 domain-containing protein [Amycolatopsis marina]SFB19979.1 Protein of unknown function [Amycolatopsis marina]